MALTDAKAKTVKLEEGKKQQKLADGGGLFLLVNKSGKYWKLDFAYGGKRKTLSVGVYPQVSLKQARAAREQAKTQLTKGVDPCQAKKENKQKQLRAEQSATFEGVAVEWVDKKAASWKANTMKSNQSKLSNHILPWLGDMHIADIKPVDVLTVAQRVESKGHIELAHRVLNFCGQVMRYAVATCRASTDPTRDLKGSLAPIVTKHRACLKTPQEVGELMRAITGFQGTHVVKCGLMLSPYVFLRPTELRSLQWQYIDFEAATITIPAESMKMKRTHIVPLSKQAIVIIKDVQALTGRGKYVFHGARSISSPMSENTINVCLKRLGYCTTTQHCAHGFRGMASTLLYGQGFRREEIEMQFAHAEKNRSVAAYNHQDFLKTRTPMMQQYADYLDGLRDGAQVIPINQKIA
ncbi:MAG: tyrosine-type recombinase/integrase [Ghiorsea sp.]